MIQKQIDEIGARDLQDLIDNEVPEGKRIEYKRELNPNSRSHKNKFLSEITSFANTNGGDLIIGIAEDEGIPTELRGMEIDDVDETIDQWVNITRHNTDPSIPANLIDITSVVLEDSRVILVVRVRESWRSPHRVNTSSNHKFYGRTASGKTELDVGELRRLMIESEQLIEQLRDFKADRITTLQSNKEALEVENVPKLVLHVIPTDAFSPGRGIDIQQAVPQNDDAPPLFHPRDTGHQSRHSVEGVFRFNGIPPVKAYTKTFRSGVIESVSTRGFRRVRVFGMDQDEVLCLDGDYLRNCLENTLKPYVTFLDSQNARLPYYIFLTLLEFDDCYVGKWLDRGFDSLDKHPIGRSVTSLPEIVIEDPTEDVSGEIDQLMDYTFNAGGMATEPRVEE